MAWISKALGGSGIAAIAATSMTALLVIVGAVLLLTLTGLWMVREASRSSDDKAARRITWMLHGHDPNDCPDDHAGDNAAGGAGGQGPSP